MLNYRELVAVLPGSLYCHRHVIFLILLFIRTLLQGSRVFLYMLQSKHQWIHYQILLQSKFTYQNIYKFSSSIRTTKRLHMIRGNKIDKYFTLLLNNSFVSVYSFVFLLILYIFLQFKDKKTTKIGQKKNNVHHDFITQTCMQLAVTWVLAESKFQGFFYTLLITYPSLAFCLMVSIKNFHRLP